MKSHVVFSLKTLNYMDCTERYIGVTTRGVNRIKKLIRTYMRLY